MASRNGQGAGPTPGSPADLGPDADPHAVARAIVLRALTQSPKSRAQLAAKLAERDVPDDVAEAVLERFEEVNLIDDAEFARMWVRSRSQTRSLARAALKRELADKGIVGDLAEEALEQLSADDEVEAARSLVRRKIRPGWQLHERSERDKHLRRLVSMLARKGYSASLAFRVADEELDAAATPEA
ncbi:regulatory protein RecX [Arthrobacter sulfonylureivorans]|uniref:regulatory protein RecX n=1 Tax=Arthrobacter sulfonylureivorans TaxID=2486855 RepID=UPI0039E66A55